VHNVLETWISAAGVAFIVTAGVNFLTLWGLRLRLRRLEMSLAEWEERLVKEVKTRAAQASVAARAGRLNPLDEALIRQHTAGGNADQAEEPWWTRLTR
jgi:hypothetical protein